MSGDVTWCREQMDRLDKRVECVEKLCVTGPEVAEPEVVAVALLHRNAPTSGPLSPRVQGSSVVPIRKKPQEFDGKVSWEAYRIQFEMLADQNGWDEGQSAVQLATSLKGPALEVLGRLSEVDRGHYSALVEVPQKKYGAMYQSETYRARFRTRVRARGEPLQQLAQDLEGMVHKAYPTAAPDLLSLLLKEQFIDALESTNLKVQVKQTRPGTMQEALASVLEFESYIKSSTGNFRVSGGSGFQAKRGKIHGVDRLGDSHEPCERDKETTGVCCWHCGRPGHKWQDCYSLKRERENRTVEQGLLLRASAGDVEKGGT
ncbi:uncharacterized protein LOC118761880 [Octopus sinensis]|uniref:Uncharacterized protein LOC118761880 n=1 Tax=Octopus sinensis TaxID=2607531 RepID=A0A7E6ELV0_9MOLL|nr:uncharacterized protein LOC118761880 [Octopus sinensis]